MPNIAIPEEERLYLVDTILQTFTYTKGVSLPPGSVTSRFITPREEFQYCIEIAREISATRNAVIRTHFNIEKTCIYPVFSKFLREDISRNTGVTDSTYVALATFPPALFPTLSKLQNINVDDDPPYVPPTDPPVYLAAVITTLSTGLTGDDISATLNWTQVSPNPDRYELYLSRTNSFGSVPVSSNISGSLRSLMLNVPDLGWPSTTGRQLYAKLEGLFGVERRVSNIVNSSIPNPVVIDKPFKIRTSSPNAVMWTSGPDLSSLIGTQYDTQVETLAAVATLVPVGQSAEHVGGTVTGNWSSHVLIVRDGMVDQTIYDEAFYAGLGYMFVNRAPNTGFEGGRSLMATFIYSSTDFNFDADETQIAYTPNVYATGPFTDNLAPYLTLFTISKPSNTIMGHLEWTQNGDAPLSYNVYFSSTGIFSSTPSNTNISVMVVQGTLRSSDVPTPNNYTGGILYVKLEAVFSTESLSTSGADYANYIVPVLYAPFIFGAQAYVQTGNDIGYLAWSQSLPDPDRFNLFLSKDMTFGNMPSISNISSSLTELQFNVPDLGWTSNVDRRVYMKLIAAFGSEIRTSNIINALIQEEIIDKPFKIRTSSPNTTMWTSGPDLSSLIGTQYDTQEEVFNAIAALVPIGQSATHVGGFFTGTWVGDIIMLMDGIFDNGGTEESTYTGLGYGFINRAPNIGFEGGRSLMIQFNPGFGSLLNYDFDGTDVIYTPNVYATGPFVSYLAPVINQIETETQVGIDVATQTVRRADLYVSWSLPEGSAIPDSYTVTYQLKSTGGQGVLRSSDNGSADNLVEFSPEGKTAGFNISNERWSALPGLRDGGKIDVIVIARYGNIDVSSIPFVVTTPPIFAIRGFTAHLIFDYAVQMNNLLGTMFSTSIENGFTEDASETLRTQMLYKVPTDDPAPVGSVYSSATWLGVYQSNIDTVNRRIALNVSSGTSGVGGGGFIDGNPTDGRVNQNEYATYGYAPLSAVTGTTNLNYIKRAFVSIDSVTSSGIHVITSSYVNSEPSINIDYIVQIANPNLIIEMI